MKYTNVIIAGLALCILLHSCIVEKQIQPQISLVDCIRMGAFQRYFEWNDSCKTYEILKVSEDNSFSIYINEIFGKKDSVYYCEGKYEISLNQNGESEACVIFKTHDAQKESAIARIAHPIDNTEDRIVRWRNNYVYICLRSCDTLYDSYNAIPYIRILDNCKPDN